VTRVATTLVNHPDFLWGAAFDRDGFRARNLDETSGARALGRDMSKALPGLYWLNLFGAPYVDLIGVERLRTAPLDPLPALQVFTSDGEHVTAIPSEDATTSSYDA
jgi:hypothetical protein